MQYNKYHTQTQEQPGPPQHLIGIQGPPGPQGPLGPQGQPGQVTYDFLRNNSLWCADGNICQIPSNKIGINFNGTKMYNSINALGNVVDFNIETNQDLYINGNTLHITKNKIYSNNRDILQELDDLKSQISKLTNLL